MEEVSLTHSLLPKTLLDHLTAAQWWPILCQRVLPAPSECHLLGNAVKCQSHLANPCIIEISSEARSLTMGTICKYKPNPEGKNAHCPP